MKPSPTPSPAPPTRRPRLPRPILRAALSALLLPVAIVPPPAADTLAGGWTTVELAWLNGSFSEQDCDSSQDTDYTLRGMGVTHTHRLDTGTRLRARGSVFRGREDFERSLGDWHSERGTETVKGGQLALGFDRTYWGMEAGIEPGGIGRGDDAARGHLGLRIGPLDRWWFEIGAIDDLPFGTPLGRTRIGVGLGGLDNRWQVRGGVQEEGPWGMVHLRLTDNLGIRGVAGGDDAQNRHAGVAASWTFGR